MLSWKFQPTASRARIVAFVRLFTRGGVALQEPCVNRDMRIERLALEGGTIKGHKPADNRPNLRASPEEPGQILLE